MQQPPGAFFKSVHRVDVQVLTIYQHPKSSTSLCKTIFYQQISRRSLRAGQNEIKLSKIITAVMVTHLAERVKRQFFSCDSVISLMRSNLVIVIGPLGILHNVGMFYFQQLTPKSEKVKLR